MTRKVKQIDLVLDAIRRGGKIVNEKYLGDVLCLASRGTLTAREMNALILPSGKHVFVPTVEAL